MALRQQAFQALRWAWASAPAASQLSAQCCSFSSAAAATIRHPPGQTIPAGHINSDLSSSACHIGLGRRRDLTLRQDLSLWKDGSKQSLADVFKGKRVVLVGFPGGPICTEKHVPGYVQAADVLVKKGMDKVVAVTVEEPSKVQEVAEKLIPKEKAVELLADNGSFMRLLGLELASAEAGKDAGPKCQRFAAVVEDGILLKLCVEKDVKQLDVSSAAKMIKVWEDIYPKGV